VARNIFEGIRFLDLKKANQINFLS